jgi:hypothetical protein
VAFEEAAIKKFSRGFTIVFTGTKQPHGSTELYYHFFQELKNLSDIPSWSTSMDIHKYI